MVKLESNRKTDKFANKTWLKNNKIINSKVLKNNNNYYYYYY